MFGLELRKKGNMQKVFSDVRKYLDKTGQNNGGVSIESLHASCRHKLQHMLESGGYFNICTIKDMAASLDIVLTKVRIDYYTNLHCIHWSEMLDDLRFEVVAFILEDFRILFDTENELSTYYVDTID